MPDNPGLKRLWRMIGVCTAAIAATVYLAVIPTLQGHPEALKNLETRLLSDSLLPSTTLTEAAVSGGRSRGGSFSAPPSPSTPTLPRSTPIPSYDYDYPSYSRGPVIVPYPTYSPGPVYVGPSGGGGGGGLVLVVIVLGFILLPIVLTYMQPGSQSASRPSPAGTPGERLNNIVTVSRLQVALLAQARELQKDLTGLTLKADLSTPEGLISQLQATVLALLRHPDYWTHCRASSETVASRELASELFERISIQERSKFRVETLANVGGQVQQQPIPQSQTKDVASHIVVTLLVGTAHDRPLFGALQSAADLKAALQILGAIPSDYLLVYELLWTPQDESDTLSSDDLIANYPELITL